MSAALAPAATEPPAGWLEWLRRELAPFPGRREMTIRLVLGVVLVTIVSMSLQVPEAAISAYMVFFVTKENRFLTTLAGAVLIVSATLAIGGSLLLFNGTLEYPTWRVASVALALFAGMYLSRVFVIGPLGLAIGFFVAMAQITVDGVPDAEIAVRGLLWLWVVLVYPIVLTVVLNQLVLPAQPQPAPGGAANAHKAKKSLLKADAFTNPAHWHYALKVTLAAMTCYVIYTGLDWSGIHTAFITCCFIALENVEATMQKAWLRLGGCLLGGLLGFLSILYVVPHMETLASLVVLVALVTAVAGWVAAGSPRIAYAGLQIGLAFFLAIFQGFAPATGLDVIRDRLVGIALGILVVSVVFHYLWPERSAASPESR